MAPAIGIKGTLLHQSQISFVNQGRTLQGVSRSFSLEMVARNFTQFHIDQGHQRCQSLLISGLPAGQQLIQKSILLIFSHLEAKV